MHSPEPVLLTGQTAISAFGHGAEALFAGVLAGQPAFAPVTRFDVTGRRVGVGALLPGSPVLFDSLAAAIDEACEQAGLGSTERAAAPLLLATHGDPDASRVPAADRSAHRTGAFATALAE